MINTLKDLERLLKLCRKQGVQKIEFDNVKLELGELPADQAAHAASEQPDSPFASFPTGELSPEQLMFYSSGGRPEDDPELAKEAG